MSNTQKELVVANTDSPTNGQHTLANAIDTDVAGRQPSGALQVVGDLIPVIKEIAITAIHAGTAHLKFKLIAGVFLTLTPMVIASLAPGDHAPDGAACQLRMFVEHASEPANLQMQVAAIAAL